MPVVDRAPRPPNYAKPRFRVWPPDITALKGPAQKGGRYKVLRLLDLSSPLGADLAADVGDVVRDRVQQPGELGLS